jgi:hypothetical protein
MSGIAQKQWALRAQQLELDQLTRIQQHAEQWRNGLTALTALFAVVSIAKGRQTFGDLTDTGRFWAILLLAVAFLLLVAGSLLAMRAAFGVPSTIWLTGENLARWEADEARRAQTTLTAAKVTFIAGVACVAIATGITWIDKKPTAAASMAVRTAAKDPVCGELLDGNGTRLRIAVKDAVGKRTEEIQLTDVEQLAIVKSCPSSP